MASISKAPTVLIMPGTWHLPSAYDVLKNHLEDAGCVVRVQPLLSLDATEPNSATCQADVDFARQRLLHLIEENGQDILVVCHSYGGIVGAGAARGLSKKTRQENGKSGGVLGLVFITAFVIPEGVSLGEFMGGKGAPYIINNQVRSNFRFGLVAIAEPLSFSQVQVSARQHNRTKSSTAILSRPRSKR